MTQACQTQIISKLTDAQVLNTYTAPGYTIVPGLTATDLMSVSEREPFLHACCRAPSLAYEALLSFTAPELLNVSAVQALPATLRCPQGPDLPAAVACQQEPWPVTESRPARALA